MAQHCTQLCDLYLTADYGLSSNALWILTTCPLKRLVITLEDYNGYDDDNSNVGGNEAILDNLACFQQIQHLRITDPLFIAKKIITTLTLHPDWMPQLSKFTISGCYDLTDQQAIAFMNTHSAIDTLHLLGSEFTDGYLDAIPVCLPNIKDVGLDFGENFTAHGIRRLVLNCSLLVSVNLYQCNILADEFPEADDSCLIDDDFLYYLGPDAIELIRFEGDGGFELDERVLEERQARRQLLVQTGHGQIPFGGD